MNFPSDIEKSQKQRRKKTLFHTGTEKLKSMPNGRSLSLGRGSRGPNTLSVATHIGTGGGV